MPVCLEAVTVAAPSHTTVDTIADHLRPVHELRTAIVAGRLLPNERLVEADLTRRLGVGRAAVRTALALLEHEGLVELEPNRGARVRLVGLPEAIEIFQALAVLEGLAVRRAAVFATQDDIAGLRGVVAEMRRLLDAGDLLKASDSNGTLHQRLRHAGGHATANGLISVLRSQLVRFEYRSILVPGRSRRSLAEHTVIVDAVAAGDSEAADAADAAMRKPLTHVADTLRTMERERASRIWRSQRVPVSCCVARMTP